MIRLDDTRLDYETIGGGEVISVPEPEPVDPQVTDTGGFEPISTDPISDRVDQIKQDAEKEVEKIADQKVQSEQKAQSIFSNVNPVILPVSILGFIAIIYNYLNK